MKTQNARELAAEAAEWYSHVGAGPEFGLRGQMQRATVSVLLTGTLYGLYGDATGALAALLGLAMIVNGVHSFMSVLAAVQAHSVVADTRKYEAGTPVPDDVDDVEHDDLEESD